MGDANDVLGCIHQNLLDAGCSEELADSCIELLKSNQEQELIRKLTEQRKCLLSRLNSCQSEIDALDYLLYSIRRRSNR